MTKIRSDCPHLCVTEIIEYWFVAGRVALQFAVFFESFVEYIEIVRCGAAV